MFGTDRDEGFTLVELMVVLLVLGVLLAFAIPMYVDSTISSRVKSCQASQRTIEGAIGIYNSSGAGPYQGGLIDGSNELITGGVTGRIALQSPPRCSTAPANAFYFTSMTQVTADQATASTGISTITMVHPHFN